MASSAKGIRAGRAYVELFADDSKLVRGLRRAQASLVSFGNSVRNIGQVIGAVGAGLVTPFIAAAKIFGSLGDELFDMSLRTGVAVESLSALGLAVELGGSSLAQFEVAIKTMQRTLFAAALNGGLLAQGFQLIGLEAKELLGLSPEQQFSAIADGISRVQDPTVRAAAALKIFGRAGTSLLPIMQKGSAGLEEFKAQAANMGLVVSGQSAAGADRFSDSLIILKRTLIKLAAAVGEQVAPVLQSAIQFVVSFNKAIQDLIGRNADLIVTLFKVAVGVTALGGAMIGLGLAIAGLGKVVGLFALATSLALGIVKSLLLVLALLLNPIVALIAGFAALGAVILHSTGLAGEALKWLGNKFVELFSAASMAFEGIKDALVAGDIGAAATVLWTTLKLAWAVGIQSLLKLWEGFKHAFFSISLDAFHGVQAAWFVVGDTLSTAWATLIAELSGVWVRFATNIKRVWLLVKNFLVKTWNHLRGIFDSSFDVEAANVAADELFESQTRQAVAAATELDRASAEQLRAELDSIQSRHDTELARIGQANLQQHGILDSEFEESALAAQGDLAEARSAWEQALLDAQRRRQEVESASAEQGIPSIGKLKDALIDVDDILNQTEKRTIDVSGGFTNAQLLALQGGTTEERIAKATEATARGVEVLRRVVEKGGLVFSEE